MNRDKQIEDMAKDIACKITWDDDEIPTVDCLETAKRLYNAGYRKASDVAEEIIKDLVKFADDKEKQMSFHGHSVWYIDADDVTDFIAELKKKYTEGEG